jgi:hypothetical protein
MTDESRPWRGREGQPGRLPYPSAGARPDTSTGRVRHPRTGQFIPAGRVPNKTNGGHKPARRGR